jgi:hypothetical protein
LASINIIGAAATENPVVAIAPKEAVIASTAIEHIGADESGVVQISSTNAANQEGVQTIGVSLARPGKLPLTATATLNWIAPELAIAATGAANSVVVKVSGAAGKSVQIVVAGKTYRRVATSVITEFSIPAATGKKSVKVVVGGKTLSKSVTVTKK